jgi:DNA polymerase
MILAMGRYAAQALLAQTVSNPVPPLGQLRGVVHAYQGIPVVVTYSPAFLLRNSGEKAKAWADLCLAKASL